MRKISIFSIFIVIVLIFQYSEANAQLKTIVSVTGSVFNEITRDPVRIKYKILNEKGKIIRRGKTNASQNGYYFVTGLKAGKNYKMLLEGNDNYFDQEFTIEIPNTDKYAEFSRDFLVPPKYKGLEIPQRVATFELNKTKLRAGADFFMDDIIATLTKNEGIKFTILCYPDNDKDLSANQSLTQTRCSSLKDFFLSKGIDAARIDMNPQRKTDPKNPPPKELRAKGKRYIGSIYYVVKEF